jgi:hypothetical protein
MKKLIIALAMVLSVLNAGAQEWKVDTLTISFNSGDRHFEELLDVMYCGDNGFTIGSHNSSPISYDDWEGYLIIKTDRAYGASFRLYVTVYDTNLGKSVQYNVRFKVINNEGMAMSQPLYDVVGHIRHSRGCVIIGETIMIPCMKNKQQ